MHKVICASFGEFVNDESLGLVQALLAYPLNIKHAKYRLLFNGNSHCPDI
jgi:hypothetical protein